MDENRGVFPVTTDAMLLADFTAGYCGAKRLRGIDIGCGSGIVALETAERCASVTFLGVEIASPAAEFARSEAGRRGLQTRVTIVNTDLRRYREFAKPAAFDFAVANPPFFDPGRGRASPDAAKNTARREQSATFADFCAAAGYAVKNSGAFLFVIRAERLAEAFAELKHCGFEPKRVQFVQKNAQSAPRNALVDARRGGRPPLLFLPHIYTEVT